VLGDKVTVRVI